EASATLTAGGTGHSAGGNFLPPGPLNRYKRSLLKRKEVGPGQNRNPTSLLLRSAFPLLPPSNRCTFSDTETKTTRID
ncbi:MAG TPA: hypothetical protein DCF68_20260, partial [Cyanothece sp. UBA12306]|nr:hypothetical protein [Cyanothece sp. UBA12306]